MVNFASEITYRRPTRVRFCSAHPVRQCLSWLFCGVAFLLPPTPIHAQPSDTWVVRLGALGSGTSDQGDWTFKSSSGLGAQVFEFSNSWGIALTAERILWHRVHLGVHLGYATTDFGLTVAPAGGGSPFTSRDETTYAPILGELQYGFLPGRLLNPRVGVTAGIFHTRDIRLRTDPAAADVAYGFENPGIVGYGVGVDLRLGDGGMWLLSFDAKSTRYAYTVIENELVGSQTLLDQDAIVDFSHLVLSLGRRF